MSPYLFSPIFMLPSIPSSLHHHHHLLSRLLSTAATTTTTTAETIWHLLRSNSSNPNLESTLSVSIPHPTPSLLSSVLSSSSPSSPSDRLLALRFFVWASLHPLLRPLPPSSFSSASLSLSLHLPSDPHPLHLLLDSYLPPLSLPAFKSLLSLSLHSPLPLPLSLLRRMPQFSLLPDVPSFNSVLRHPSVSPSLALSLLDEMTSSALRPDITTYSTLIKKLTSDNQLAAARSLLDRMKSDGCTPNVVAYSALLDGACSCGDLDAAVEILDQMEREGCAPNVVTYTCLIKCLCEHGKLDEALGVLDRMGRNGCQPNRVTLRTLLNGLCGRGRVRDAYEIIERVVGEGKGVSSEGCYSALVMCLLRSGDRAVAEGLLGRMLGLGVRPDGVACNSLMRLLCEKRCFLDGYKWICEFEEKGFLDCVDSDIYSHLLAGLCEEGLLVEAVEVGKRVVESEVRLEASCVDAVVEQLERFGEGNLASQIMRLQGE